MYFVLSYAAKVWNHKNNNNILPLPTRTRFQEARETQGHLNAYTNTVQHIASSVRLASAMGFPPAPGVARNAHNNNNNQAFTAGEFEGERSNHERKLENRVEHFDTRAVGHSCLLAKPAKQIWQAKETSVCPKIGLHCLHIRPAKSGLSFRN